MQVEVYERKVHADI